MRFEGVLLVATLIAAVSAPAAHADDVNAAKMHYQRGTTFFDLQKYAEAAKEYEAAYEAKNDPALLFNIAQAYRFAGEYAKAVAAFRSYLRRVPDAENRPEVELRIAELQKLLEDQKHNQQSPPSGTLNPGETRMVEPQQVPPVPAPAAAPTVSAAESAATRTNGRLKLITGIAVGAVGIAAIAIGGAFEGLAKSQNDALSHPTAGSTFDPSKEQALKTDETVGAVMLGLGAAALVAGTVAAVLGVRERNRATHAFVAPSIGAQQVGVVVDARF